MKRMIIVASILSTAIAGEAIADCNTPPTKNLKKILSGQTVCAVKGNGDKWQEEHNKDGTLWDYKKGPNDPVDPRSKVGSWSVNETGQGAAKKEEVCYDYANAGRYCYTLHQTGQRQYDLCTNGALDVNATLKPISAGGCGN